MFEFDMNSKADLICAAFKIEEMEFDPDLLDFLAFKIDGDKEIKKHILNFYKHGNYLMQQIYLELLLRQQHEKPTERCTKSFFKHPADAAIVFVYILSFAYVLAEWIGG